MGHMPSSYPPCPSLVWLHCCLGLVPCKTTLGVLQKKNKQAKPVPGQGWTLSDGSWCPWGIPSLELPQGFFFLTSFFGIAIIEFVLPASGPSGSAVLNKE